MSLLSKIVRLGKSMLPLEPSVLLDMTPALPLSIASFTKQTTDTQKVKLNDDDDVDNSFQSLEAWQVVTDKEINGLSHATFEVKQDKQDITFARFQGQLTKRVVSNNEPVLSGFAACQRILYDPLIDISKYAYVDVTMRSDGRPYILSLRLESMNHRERYQGILSYQKAYSGNTNKNNLCIDNEEWTKQRLHFKNLMLTFNGRENTIQRDIDGTAKLMSVGIFTADGIDGPFCVDIQDISLVAEPETIHTTR